ncbi:MAG: domain S-box protein [Mucilaginibacter sp.]|nr:domain S-box protein [Mucilaginibacter sp.]
MQTKIELYEKVTPLAHLGIWERNLTTGEIYWNQVVREIYETEKNFDPSLNETIAFYVDPPALKTLFDNAISTGNSLTAELQLRTAKNKLKWVKVRMQADIEKKGSTVIYGTIEDISEQRNLLNILAEREQQFHHAFEFAPIGMALVSSTGSWIRVNKMLCDMLGWKKEDFLRKTFQDITHPDDLDLDLKQMHELLEGKTTSYSMEKRYFHQNGRIIWVLLSVTLVRDRQGNPLYFVSQIKDITERKNMEIQRDKALETIKAQNSRLLNFAHIVSHNLRSHAGNIQMLTNMISQEEDTGERESLISMLGINAVNLQETLEHLNEVVDIRAGGKQTLKSLNLLNEIEKAEAIVSESLKQAKADVVILVEPDIEVTYNQAYFESILLNLLTNSIKYRNKDHELKIRITAKSLNDKVILAIEDNGIGINLALHGKKIFGMYNTFNGNKDARGIGLFLVKNQVEAMGGTITVESVPGEGTKFEITFSEPHF